MNNELEVSELNIEQGRRNDELEVSGLNIEQRIMN